MPTDPDDYKKNRAYYIGREKSSEGKKKRVERDQARTAAIKSGRLKDASDPREVDHKRPLAKGGGNTAANIQVISRKANRKKYDH